MERGLDEADAGGATLLRSIHGCIHELAADTEVLHGGVDGDGADAVDHGALVHAIAANDAALVLGYDAVEVRV